MKTLFILALIFSTSFGRDSRRGGIPSASPGDDLFFFGEHLEWSLNPAGTFGNRDQVVGASYGGSHVPDGAHHRVTGKLGVTVDYGLDGFDVPASDDPPAYSGDAFAEGYSDVGFHVSFHGQNGLEAWNNMPHLNDDDDADFSTTPYRGCVSCSKGERADSCYPLDTDCSCNQYTTAYSYTCPFKRWDITTDSLVDTSNATVNSAVWVGVASAYAFENSTSGVLKPTGEQVTITKTIYAHTLSTVVYEDIEIDNTGNVDLVNVTLFWTIVPTLEAFNHTGFGNNASTDFANYFSIPYQFNGSLDSRAMSYSRGQFYNMTVALGAADSSARAWFEGADIWREADRPYSGDVAFDKVTPQSDTESFGEYVMGLAITVPSVSVGTTVTKRMFWAFHPSEIEDAFDRVTPYHAPLTTQPLTTQPVTSQPLTTQPATSQPLTTKELTTSPLTTQPLTTKPLTTSPATTQPLTTKPLTTKPLTTQPLTTKPLTTFVKQTPHYPTTKGVLQSPGGSSVVGDEAQTNNNTNSNAKIIASIFGVAGVILLALAIGGIILAVKRLRSNPVE